MRYSGQKIRIFWIRTIKSTRWIKNRTIFDIRWYWYLIFSATWMSSFQRQGSGQALSSVSSQSDKSSFVFLLEYGTCESLCWNVPISAIDQREEMARKMEIAWCAGARRFPSQFQKIIVRHRFENTQKAIPNEFRITSFMNSSMRNYVRVQNKHQQIASERLQSCVDLTAWCTSGWKFILDTDGPKSVQWKRIIGRSPDEQRERKNPSIDSNHRINTPISFRNLCVGR